LRLTREKAEVFRSGKMGRDMRVSGKLVKLAVEEDLFMLTAMSTKANG